ncbi:TetR/AcrR family transcriptional regulator [Actinomadura craniellae]|uniref:TetR/AcrR family transcriptional regulator n=1 Tax=Actinomadura craniellae TaxID=2231787 RepID=A0A365HD40_9ACTN|nr:TetR/AcrR family transcriptional regulator [Actinomadura craniellae]RAY16928.1 TetR/AcrR family transcriptional regulator [Actinomadura craniellae]
MGSGQGSGTESSKTRTAILDAAEQLMMEQGYAAVSSRRVADRAGVNSAMVYYHFGTMDDLFIALFRRGADQSFERQARALSSAQPLWALWESIHDQSHTALTMEFIALANHRKAIRSEISKYSRRFRTMQLDAVSKLLEGYGIGPDICSPITMILMLSGISRFLLMEEAFDLFTGHEETIALVEKHLRDIEGERQSGPGAG